MKTVLGFQFKNTVVSMYIVKIICPLCSDCIVLFKIGLSWLTVRILRYFGDRSVTQNVVSRTTAFLRMKTLVYYYSIKSFTG